MHNARAPHVEIVGERPRLRVAGRGEFPPRPAWSILGWTIAVTMILWATGVIELPAADHRLVDWIGGLAVLAVLVAWVRANAGSLAAANEPRAHDCSLRVRVIRARRPALPSMDGPDIEPRRPPSARPRPS